MEGEASFGLRSPGAIFDASDRQRAGYQNRTVCQWELAPHDLAPIGAVRCYLDVWKRVGLDQRINEILRMMVREKVERAADPCLVVLGSQSVCAAAGEPDATTGVDGTKSAPGRCRGLAADVVGLIIVVVAAPVYDKAIGTALLNRVALAGAVRTALVDQGFKNSVFDHG